jgi:hypothetical protein
MSGSHFQSSHRVGNYAVRIPRSATGGKPESNRWYRSSWLMQALPPGREFASPAFLFPASGILVGELFLGGISLFFSSFASLLPISLYCCGGLSLRLECVMPLPYPIAHEHRSFLRMQMEYRNTQHLACCRAAWARLNPSLHPRGLLRTVWT